MRTGLKTPFPWLKTAKPKGRENVRIENYEILKCNQWCYQVYRVMPEGWENRGKFRTSPIDGRRLVGMECYPASVGAAVRRVAEFCLRDGIDASATVDGLLGRIETLRRKLDEL